MERLDHVALVTPALEPVLERLAPLSLPVGPVQEFHAEGTREVYLGAEDRSARLLLVQPLGAEGPYARALSRRGPGLHHVAWRVLDLEAYLQGLRSWLLHPHSLRSIPACRTAWLGRAGIGLLLEVTEGDPISAPPVVDALEVPAGGQGALLEALGIGASRDDHAAVSVAGQRWLAAELAR